MTQRLHNLDMLRGGAAVAVMCAHAALLGQVAISPVVSDVPSLLSHLGATAVWLFFVVSGLVISQPFVRGLIRGGEWPSMRSYSLKRTARIYPLYWVCAVVVVVFVGWGGAGPIGRVAHSLLLHNVVPGRSRAFIPVSWTLTLEVFFYLAVPAVAFALQRSSRGRPIAPDRLALVVLLGWVAAVTYLAVIPFAIDSTSRSDWLRSTFPSMMGMFAPGVLLAIASVAGPGTSIAQLWRGLQKHPRLVLVGAAGFCGLGAALAAIDPTGARTSLAAWDLSRHSYAVGYGLLVAWAAMRPRWEFPGVRVVEYVGDISYGVYLIHGTLLLLLLENPSLIPMRTPGLGSYAVHVVFLAVITLALAAASWRFLESPVNRWARSVAARWTSDGTRPDRRPAPSPASGAG